MSFEVSSIQELQSSVNCLITTKQGAAAFSKCKVKCFGFGGDCPRRNQTALGKMEAAP